MNNTLGVGCLRITPFLGRRRLEAVEIVDRYIGWHTDEGLDHSMEPYLQWKPEIQARRHGLHGSHCGDLLH